MALRHLILVLFFFSLMVQALAQQGPPILVTPPVSSADRTQILELIRPEFNALFRQKVQFRIDSLLLGAGLAKVTVHPMNQDGHEFTLQQWKSAVTGDCEQAFVMGWDNASQTIILQKIDEHWKIIEKAPLCAMLPDANDIDGHFFARLGVTGDTPPKWRTVNWRSDKQYCTSRAFEPGQPVIDIKQDRPAFLLNSGFADHPLGYVETYEGGRFLLELIDKDLHEWAFIETQKLRNAIHSTPAFRFYDPSGILVVTLPTAGMEAALDFALQCRASKRETR